MGVTNYNYTRAASVFHTLATAKVVLNQEVAIAGGFLIMAWG